MKLNLKCCLFEIERNHNTTKRSLASMKIIIISQEQIKRNIESLQQQYLKLLMKIPSIRRRGGGVNILKIIEEPLFISVFIHINVCFYHRFIL